MQQSLLKTRYAEVAVPLPLFNTFTYEIPEDLSHVETGSIVMVPFGKRRITGYIVEIKESSNIKNPKKITSLLYPQRVFSDEAIGFFRYISNHYLSPIGEVIKMTLPPGFESKSDLYVRRSEASGMELDGKAKALMDALGGEKTMPVKRALRMFDLNMKELKDLQRARFIDLFEGLNHVQTGPKMRMRIEAVKEKGIDQYKTRSLKEKKLLNLLASKTEGLDLADARRDLGITGKSVKKLVSEGYIRIREVEYERTPYLEKEVERDHELELFPEQENALARISRDIDREEHRTHLLYGITGSGKTEVYMRLISRVLHKGKTALALVPEISLTPQLIHRFRARFGDIISVIHSNMSRGERFDQWRKILKGDAKIVIGARSALFSPLENIGLIVVDEEHDSSYKQEDKIMYNARDLAIERGRIAGAPVLLGSATPSMESYHKARCGDYDLSVLSQRPTDYGLPSVDIIDLRGEKGKFGKKGFISEVLLEAIRENSSIGGKTILFLNRRGFSSSLLCYTCGTTVKCPHCAVSMKYHESKGKLLCHYCDHEINLYGFCETCGSKSLIKCGFGTEQLEKEINSHFPDLRVERMDRDTTSRKFSHEKIIKRLEKGEIDVLIGTQMVTKGLDAKGVTLVGVVLADISLNIPDFRSCERTFSLLTQVAGRSGRGKVKGRVLIQTFNPEHYSIFEAKNQNFEAFFEKEIVFRRDVQYPPFVRLANVHFSSLDSKAIEKSMVPVKKISEELLNSDARFASSIEMLGPCPSPLEKLKDKYRWQMLLKCRDNVLLHEYVSILSDKLSKYTQKTPLAFKIDVDPQSFM